jgi:CHASE3 domain sensor protein
MAELIPYFGALVTLLFSAAFYWGIQEIRKYKE